MRKLIVMAATLLGLFLAAPAFSQDASLGGNVTDVTGGVIPGATVTAANEATGVVSTVITNSAGVYSFPRLPIGAYTVKAEQPGFQARTFTKVSLGTGQQARLNFQLEIGGVTSSVEVTTSGEQLLLETGSSVGDVLPAETVTELPLVNRNALDLIKVMSGVVVSDDPIFGANNTTFSGVSASAVNVQRDGVTVNDVRFPTGINAATRLNPDLVGEFKLVLAPVDAEAGRGGAQVQVSTKSGTNSYHGSAVWTVQNTSLDPNTWENNRSDVTPPWRNMHEISVSTGGPIIKNKTFFFVLYDQQIAKRREPYNAMSLTPCARKGIFRFWDGWTNGNVRTVTNADGTTPVIASVDTLGNPVRPQWGPGADYGVNPYTGQLRYASVFGTLTRMPTTDDCSDFNPATDLLTDGAGATVPWDQNGRVMDPSGFIADFLEKLPEANNYDIGDGLNTAGYRWIRTAFGAENLYGVGEDTYRKQINIKIDHNFNDKHRISGNWSYEKDHAEDTLRTWPQNSWSGGGQRRPQILTVNFVSNIGASFLNEFRFGMSRTGSNVEPPTTYKGQGEDLQAYLAQFGTLANGEVGVIEPGMGLACHFRTDTPCAFGAPIYPSTPYGTRGNWAIGDMLDTSPRYTWGDTLSWIRGNHSFRFGGEIRRSSSYARSKFIIGNGFGNSFPEIQGGELPATPTTFTNVTGVLTGDGAASNGNMRAMRDLLVFLSGSLTNIKQMRYINNVKDTDWNDPLEEPYMVRNTVMNEFSLFAKDDWKVTPALTVNLGLRYDYYGVPYLSDGMTVGLTGGGDAIFGPAGGYSNWFTPIGRGDVAPGDLVTLRSIGPGGEHPNESIFPRSWKNIGPAVGFAYELPWLGKGKTSIRGGYQLSYVSMSGNFSDIQSAASQNPGFTYLNNWSNRGEWQAGDYFGIKDLKASPLLANGVPITSGAVPGFTEYDLYERSQALTAYASDYTYPRVHKLTFSITRNVSSNLTVDLRYVGSLTRKNFSSRNLNTPNFLTNGLLEAFDAARRGEDPELLDQLFAGVALPTFGPACTVGAAGPGGATCRGGEALRAASGMFFDMPYGAPGSFTALNSMLANGNYQGLANALNWMSRAGGRRGQYIDENGFPVNFIKPSPQFNNATLNENRGYSNYHSFEAQVTLRPTRGVSFQSTYTWSKNLGYNGGVSPDPRDPSTGYVLLGSDRPHNWVTYGTFDLPFGPNRLIGSTTTGVLAKVIGGWQLGWITTVQSGSPLSMTANCGLYGNCTPDIVNGGIDPSSVGVHWPGGADSGSFFTPGRYEQVDDPQCGDASVVSPNLRGFTGPLCTLKAIRDTETGQIVLQNPLPGHLGSMSYNSFRNLTRWNVDMSLSKSVTISEGKTFQLRADITNIFNHPFASGTLGASGTRITFPTAPSMNINGNDALGLYSYKVGGRTLQAMARFSF